MTEIISYGIIGLMILILAFLVAYPLHFLWKPVYKCIMGTLALIMTNIIGISFGFSIGINIITILICSFLGLPGYTMLILFRLLL